MHITATLQVQEALGGQHFPHLESPSLRLEKFVRIAEKRDGEHLKKEEIDAVVKTHGRHAESAKPFAPPGARTLVMKLGGRLIVNQAGGIIGNAGLCLHRHFGYPYIPGSAVKGCARHAAWCRWDDAETAGEKADLARRIALTFGYPTGDNRLDGLLKAAGIEACAGSVAFLPAMPHGKTALVTDIVNCHHKDYYARKEGKGERATDDESPVPNFFPAVEAGASFVFAVVPVRGRAAVVERAHGFSPAEFALDMLREAVELHGIGAKTAAGYGWFEEDAEGQASLEKAARDAGMKRRAAAAAAQRQAALAAMSPEDRRVEELGALSRDEFIAQCINSLRDKGEAEQRAMVRALLEKHRGIWMDDKTAKPEKKGGKRAAAVREVAAKLGVQLP